MNPLFRKSNNPIDRAKFKEELSKRSDDFIEKMVEKARQQGISENDIQAGLRLIKTL